MNLREGVCKWVVEIWIYNTYAGKSQKSKQKFSVGNKYFTNLIFTNK